MLRISVAVLFVSFSLSHSSPIYPKGAQGVEELEDAKFKKALRLVTRSDAGPSASEELEEATRALEKLPPRSRLVIAKQCIKSWSPYTQAKGWFFLMTCMETDKGHLCKDEYIAQRALKVSKYKGHRA